ncbi:MAG: anion permease [Planctomycetaceae bacterium]|nr:anion permease [Planctomycetaceae bacterium]
MSEEPQIVLSPVEQRVEVWRGRVGILLAPLLFGYVLTIQGWEIPVEAQRLAAVMVAVVILWITEPIPMSVSALLGACLCVILKVADVKTVFSPFADPLIFLFIGAFILARGIFIHQLDKRLAYWVLSRKIVGASPSRILFAYGAVTAFLSGWISNTATTAMMFAIGLSLLKFLEDHSRSTGIKLNPKYATGMMLMTSFSASIGGLATPIGTPPNLIGMGFLKAELGISISFFQWCLFGMPLVAVLYVCLFTYMNWCCPAGVSKLEGCEEMLQSKSRELGGWTSGQISTVIAFGLTIVCWIVPGIVSLLEQSDLGWYRNLVAGWPLSPLELVKRIPESVAALLGAVALFLLPGNQQGKAMSWKEAEKIDWGVILIYGGGYTLGVLSEKTGLGTAIGQQFTTMIPGASPLGLLIICSVVAILISETTSNTAAVTIVVPVVIALAKGAGLDPVIPALGATLAGSLGFMLPVSTPCNAIVYGSGYIPISRMIRYGFLLDMIGLIVIVATVRLLVPLSGIAMTAAP